MPTTLPLTPAIRFHLSLNVADLTRSVEFYRVLFGREPAKLRGDYAKFELDDPPLVLSLEPNPGRTGGTLNHLGFRLPDAATLVAMQERLERAGLRCRREEGVECCYARQSKFWAHDPDGTLWEMYTFEGDIDHRGVGQVPEAVRPTEAVPGAEPKSWEHRLTDPVPGRIPLGDAEADEVRLRGSYNVPLSGTERQGLLREALRVLRPGGRLFVHVLVADRPLSGDPQLPGPAALVKAVPLEGEPLRELESAGFQGLRLLKFDAKPCFVRGDVEMREMQLEGWKPAPAAGAPVAAVYRGPHREVVADDGTVFPRGERVSVAPARAERLRHGSGADQFTFLGADPGKAH